MINSKTAESDVQGTEDLTTQTRLKLESQLDDINAAGQALDSIKYFLIQTREQSENKEEHDTLTEKLDKTLKGLAFFYRVLSQTHADLNQSENGEK